MVMALGWVSCANAASNVTVTISGTVQATPPCVINDGRPLTAPFGDVQIAKIDGNYGITTIEYTLVCSRPVTNEVRMQVRGNGTWLTSLLAVPGIPELGIALRKDGAALAINTWANFDSRTRPVLQAVLVKRAQDSDIKTGTFSASATLVVDYR